MGDLIWANLRARPVRTFLSVLAVALQVFLLLFLMGLTHGTVSEWGKRAEGIGSDLLIQPPDAPLFFAFSKAVLPEALAESVGQAEGVETVSPTVAVVNNTSMTVIFGIDFETYNRLGGGFRFLAGGPFGGPYDVIVDDIRADSRDLKVGDAIELLDRQWRVSGIVEHGRGARQFIPLRTAQDLLGVGDRVSMFWVQTKGEAEPVRQNLTAIVPDLSIRLMDEYLSLMVSSNLPAVKPFTNSVIGVGLLITFMVVLLSMYTVVLERTREIAILKALGASRWNIVGLLVREGLLIGFLGVLLGIGLSYGLKEAVNSWRPTMQILITYDWILRAVALAMVGCVLGSFYPALRASAADPLMALANE